MKINGITVQAPIAENFKINPVEYSKKTRMASGRLIKNIIAVKDNFSLTYKGLKYSDYKIFYDAFVAGNPVLFNYEDNGVEKSATVYIVSVPRGIYQDASSISHNITIVLEEV